MIEPNLRVCPSCGEPAGEFQRCVTCGANLAAMRAMLPTRGEWEAANPLKAAAAMMGEPPRPNPPEPPRANRRTTARANRQAKAPTERRSGRAASASFRKQVVVSVAVIAAFAVVVLTASKPSSPPPRSSAGAGGPPSSGSRGSTGTSTTSPGTPGRSAGTATLASCVAAWNGGKSAEHRHDLARAVARATKPAAVIATYAGPDRMVARVGGGNPVLVRAGVCVIAADDLLFLQQPDGSWGLTKATATSFTSISRDLTWTAEHANAVVQLGAPTRSGALTAGAKQSSLVVLRSSDVGTG